MVIKEQSVLNAANLSLWMVNVSQAILVTSGEESILDLKARHHGLRYAQEVFKILPENTKPINIAQLFEKIPVIGRIHGNLVLFGNNIILVSFHTFFKNLLLKFTAITLYSFLCHFSLLLSGFFSTLLRAKCLHII